jgi:hypothetical protein
MVVDPRQLAGSGTFPPDISDDDDDMDRDLAPPDPHDDADFGHGGEWRCTCSTRATGSVSPLYPGPQRSFINERPFYFLCCGQSAIATGKEFIRIFCTRAAAVGDYIIHDVYEYILYDIVHDLCTY